ncbi:class A sortase [Mammaliicoccus sp. P-M55]|uniref:class A sortase n=1 Tax=Mammaliicoccus sp. P-M55 TaxID=2898714 RepID=UPI001EFB083A|nr:class A sortase [Mammaliicoccus sp. P-M55]
MRWVLKIIGILLIITAISIFFWNDIRTYFTERVNDKVIESYENQNDKVKVNPIESWITKTETNKLKVNDNMVGYLKVPSADISEPIFKGPATERNLKNGLSLVDENEQLNEQNVAIAGHRVEGAGIRFNNLDRAKVGDSVELITVKGTKKYKINNIKNVKPSQVEVLNEHKGKPNQLTLITCDTYNPETLLFEERMIYTAVEEKSS